MGKGFFVGVVAVALSAATAAQAQAPGKKAAAKPVASSVCKLTTVVTGTVASILDGRTLVLDDGREVRLAAIAAAPPTEPEGAATKAALASLVAGQPIELRAAIVAPEVDRAR
jgi:endonuclease YncB( thermonuclease family)